MKNSPLAVRLYVLGLFIQPLSAIRWQWIESDCQGNCPRHSEGSWKPPCFYAGKAPRISLIPQTIRQGHQRLDPEHSYWFLPPSVKDWLIHLRFVELEGDTVTCIHPLSITCVLHQPCQGDFGASDRLWHRADIGREGVVRAGEILLIPLTQGRIDFVRQDDPNASAALAAWDFSKDFTKRVFPFLSAGDQHWFQTRISGASDFSPFAFASLIRCTLPEEVLVAIEIIPPLGPAWDDNMQIIGGLLGHFANCSCPCEAKSANIFDGASNVLVAYSFGGPVKLGPPERRRPPSFRRALLNPVPPNQSSATQNLGNTLPLKREHYRDIDIEMIERSADAFVGSYLSGGPENHRRPPPIHLLRPVPPNANLAAPSKSREVLPK
jgi:hypothetical protein